MISTRRRKSLGSTHKMTHKFKLKKNANVTEIDTAQRLTDEKFIGEAIFDCNHNNLCAFLIF
jgi:hypothetical protein